MVAPAAPAREEFPADFPAYLPGPTAADIARGVDNYALRNGFAYAPNDTYLANEARREVVTQLADWAEEALNSGDISAPKSPQKRVTPKPVTRPLPEGVTEDSLAEKVAADIAAESSD